jgi:hypothetical protein
MAELALSWCQLFGYADCNQPSTFKAIVNPEFSDDYGQMPNLLTFQFDRLVVSGWLNSSHHH